MFMGAVNMGRSVVRVHGCRSVGLGLLFVGAVGVGRAFGHGESVLGRSVPWRCASAFCRRGCGGGGTFVVEIVGFYGVAAGWSG